MTLRRTGFACALSLLVWARPAASQVAIAADPSVTFGGSEHDAVGQAIDARFGYRFGLPRSLHFHTVIFQPEVIAGYAHLPGLGRRRQDVQAGRIGGGTRLGCLCGFIEAFAFGHAAAAFGTRETNALFDAGAALDWRFSACSLGLHFSYNVFASGGIHWYEAGPHFEYRWFAW